jgi:hypothetical protein
LLELDLYYRNRLQTITLWFCLYNYCWHT